MEATLGCECLRGSGGCNIGTIVGLHVRFVNGAPLHSKHQKVKDVLRLQGLRFMSFVLAHSSCGILLGVSVVRCKRGYVLNAQTRNPPKPTSSHFLSTQKPEPKTAPLVHLARCGLVEAVTFRHTACVPIREFDRRMGARRNLGLSQKAFALKGYSRLFFFLGFRV